MSGITIVEPWLWGAFVAGVVVLLILDLTVLHRKAHAVSIREALIVSAGWIGVALAFNAWFGYRYGVNPGIDFLTGYLVEKSLSVDNLFVILLIFQAFAIPSQYQHRVLFWGILGAIVMRGTLILVGAGLLHQFHWVIYIFGAILIISGARFLFSSDDEEQVGEHWSVRIVGRFYPVTKGLRGQHFFTVEDGVRKATPLFVTLVAIEATDLIFAVDSIPAVLAVTPDAFIAFSSNILALLGLRALYFVIADLVAKLRYLKPGLALVLGFVGAKMLLSEVFKIPSWVSLLVILGILSTAGLSSWYVNRVEQRAAK